MQKLIVKIGPNAANTFSDEVNYLMKDGWCIVPETFRLSTQKQQGTDNDVDVCGCVLMRQQTFPLA